MSSSGWLALGCTTGRVYGTCDDARSKDVEATQAFPAMALTARPQNCNKDKTCARYTKKQERREKEKEKKGPQCRKLSKAPF